MKSPGSKIIVHNYNAVRKCPHCQDSTQHGFIQLSKTMKLRDTLSPVIEQLSTEQMVTGGFRDVNMTLEISVPMIHTCKDVYYCSQCYMCKDICIWKKIDPDSLELVYPRMSIHEPLSSIIDKKFSEPYEQARIIALDSPPAACMLLRLCLERVCDELDAPKGSSLEIKIEEISKTHAMGNIDVNLMTIIRKAGNISAHNDLDSKDINGDDIEKLIIFTHVFISNTIQKIIEMKNLSKKIVDK